MSNILESNIFIKLNRVLQGSKPKIHNHLNTLFFSMGNNPTELYITGVLIPQLGIQMLSSTLMLQVPPDSLTLTAQLSPSHSFTPDVQELVTAKCLAAPG